MEKGKEINQNEERKKGKKKTLYSDYYKSPFAVRLRYLMGFNEETKKSKINQSDVAGEWTTRQTISNYMLGNTLPTSDDITRIAEYFKVSTDYLLGLTDAPTPLKTEEQQALRVAADFTELNESLIYLIHTLSKNGQSVVNDLIGIIVEEYCLHNELIKELKISTDKDLPTKILDIAENKCTNEVTAKEFIWDAENEFNRNLAFKYLLENSLITSINKYFRFDDIQEKYKEFLANKEKILESFKVSENEQKES